MLEIFYPDIYVEKFQDVDLRLLSSKNIKGVILDIDNTLVASHVEVPDENVIKWIERLKKEGFKACIVSNASKKRVIKFNEHLKINAIHRASKPGKKALLKAIKLMEIDKSEAAIIGDQIFTDVYGGNRIGILTILVKPIDKNEFFFVRLKRYLERIVLKSYFKSKGQKYQA